MKLSRLISLLLITSMIFSCQRVSSPEAVVNARSQLQKLAERGTLRVVTDFNSTSYFIYRGQALGYQYEMLQELANHLGVNLEVEVNNNLDSKFKMLENDEVDLIAVNLTVTKARREKMDFTVAHTKTSQVLIQRKPENWQKLSKNVLQDSLIQNQLDIGGKTVYVQKNSAYAKRLKNLSEEIGEVIHIMEVEEGEDILIEKVATGEIDYTVSDENVAQMNETFFGNIDISLPVSFPQNLAWAVPKGADDLKYTIDTWLVDFKKTLKYALIYNKYYRSSRTAEIKDSDYFSNFSGKISPYDDAIKLYAIEIGWDWRLLASMIYQESRFNPEAKSWVGAYGLMQLMPRTGARFGVTPQSSTKMQIRAGVMFIRWLDERFDYIADPVEKQKFILASYNVGMGHVLDARALAIKNNSDPNVWDGSVAEFLLTKTNPEVYTDSVVKYGYCRGTEPYNYVVDIIERYEHYKNLVSE